MSIIYTYRNCSKCMAQVKTSEQENRYQIYEASVEILEPEIKKLKDLLFYQDKCNKFIGQLMGHLSARADISDLLKTYIIRLLDLLSQLDHLKTMKASLNNDFSQYKRAKGFSKKDQSAAAEDQNAENHMLYLFLANPNTITNNLVALLKESAGYDRVLTQCAQLCYQNLESERYLLPNEKHCYLRALPYIIYLLDANETNEKKTVFKAKTFNMSKIAKVFKRCPVIMAYGDMQYQTDDMVRRAPHFDAKTWDSMAAPDAKVAEEEYKIVCHIGALRARHDEYISRFVQMMTDVRMQAAKAAKAARAQKNPALVYDPVPIALARNVFNVVLQGVQLMSDFTSRILQQAAWKYSNPNMDPTIDTEIDYERAIRYNYTAEELSALVEVIAMVKGLARLFLRNDTVLSPIIRTFVHADIQEFVQLSILEMIADATKKKRQTIRNDLVHLREICADWAGGFEPFSELSGGGGGSGSASLSSSSHKKSRGGGSSSSAVAADEGTSFPRRNVGPAGIQVDLMRSIVYGLLQSRKEIGEKNSRVLEEFYVRSMYYPYLMNLQETVAQSSDLGDLWYREFYLELSKRLQFPINMSLPSILVDHILEGEGSAQLLEYALYPLDIYNDAANKALVLLHQKFLYNEIEAETNLCFDQFLYKLSEKVYTHYKSMASAILFDKTYRQQLEAVSPENHARLAAPRSRFEVLLGQRHVQILGRTVDLNRLVAQRVNRLLRSNIDYAISRFEAFDLSAVYELDQALINVRLTHALLSRVLSVDPWDMILLQGNEAVSISSYHNRILLHILFEIASDFAPNYNYNYTTSRFLRAKYDLSEEVERDQAPKPDHKFLFGTKALHAHYSLPAESQKRVFDARHVAAIVHLLGRSHLPMLITQCLRNIDLKIQSMIVPYVDEICSALPPSSKLPLYHYGTQGGYGAFMMKLQELISYPDIPIVLRQFKEVGNIILLFMLFDQQLKETDLLAYVASAPILGITPDTVTKEKCNPATAPLATALAEAAGLLQGGEYPYPRCSAFTCKNILDNAAAADRMYRQPPHNISLFSAALRQINAMIDPVRDVWCGAAYPAENGVMDVEGPHEFYRMWSALQFIFCMQHNADIDGFDKVSSNVELYGDSINFGACLFIHFLGQRYRFEALSFAYHILKMEEAADLPCKDAETLKFLENAAYDRELNRKVFDILASYAQAPSVNEALVINPPDTLQLKYFVEVQGGGAMMATAAAAAPATSTSSSHSKKDKKDKKDKKGGEAVAAAESHSRTSSVVSSTSASEASESVGAGAPAPPPPPPLPGSAAPALPGRKAMPPPEEEEEEEEEEGGEIEEEEEEEVNAPPPMPARSNNNNARRAMPAPPPPEEEEGGEEEEEYYDEEGEEEYAEEGEEEEYYDEEGEEEYYEEGEEEEYYEDEE